MPRLNKDEKERIRELPKKELENIVIKLASKDKLNYDFIQITYLNSESGEKELFEEAKDDIYILTFKGYKGFSEQLRMKNMLAACIKRLNEFTKISKNKSYEAELLIYILNEAFSKPPTFFGTCFTAFDSKVGSILKRLIGLVTKKMHPDYLYDYKDSIDDYLKRIHETSNHLDFIYELPPHI